MWAAPVKASLLLGTDFRTVGEKGRALCPRPTCMAADYRNVNNPMHKE